MIRETVNAVVACLLTLVLCAVAYPLVVWAFAWLAFPREAEGSLVSGPDGKVIGSELIAQPFASDKYFSPRPSAADFKADAASGSNLGTKNPDLHKKIAERAEALKATDTNPAPVDLVTASGAGLDPHISPEAAIYQSARVAAARKMSVGQVKSVIERHVDRSGAIIGAPPRVNVLLLNLALDKETPVPPSPAADSVTEPTAERQALEAVTTRVDELAARIERLGVKIDTLPRDTSDSQAEVLRVKTLSDRLAAIVDDSRTVAQLGNRAAGLDGKLNDADLSVQRLRDDVRKARDAVKALTNSYTARPATSATRR
jgi:K+-transporting ATPase ATPase C chain